jgi:hypothetical protein
MSPLLAVMQAGIGRQSRKRLEIECQEGPVVRQLSQIKTYKEDPIRRNIRPTFFDLLELSRLSANFDLERIPAIGRNTQIYFGTERLERPSRAGAPQVVFVRAISHCSGLVTESGARKAFTQSPDKIGACTIQL